MGANAIRERTKQVNRLTYIEPSVICVLSSRKKASHERSPTVVDGDGSCVM